MRRCITALAFSLTPVLLAADELHLYESIDTISIGRVFLTPRQRSWLDAHRHEAVVDRVATPAEDPRIKKAAEQSTKAVLSPAGYIIRNNGGQQRWSDGDFVSSGLPSLAAMRFPGDVKIVRHASSQRDDIALDEDATDKVKVSESSE